MNLGHIWSLFLGSSLNKKKQETRFILSLHLFKWLKQDSMRGKFSPKPLWGYRAGALSELPSRTGFQTECINPVLVLQRHSYTGRRIDATQRNRAFWGENSCWQLKWATTLMWSSLHGCSGRKKKRACWMWHIKISGIAARHKKITPETGLMVYQLVGSVETEDKCCHRPSVSLLSRIFRTFGILKVFSVKRFVNKLCQEFNQKMCF